VGCSECGDEPLGSVVTELVIHSPKTLYQLVHIYSKFPVATDVC
jgi:hypothetical protein